MGAKPDFSAARALLLRTVKKRGAKSKKSGAKWGDVEEIA